MICHGCYADRELNNSRLCETCQREKDGGRLRSEYPDDVEDEVAMIAEACGADDLTPQQIETMNQMALFDNQRIEGEYGQ